MAIETRIINGSFTELYTGGGNFMTQAKATHFHSFWTRKILAPTESVSDFREVTAAEKEKLEAADAAWERPPQSFIDAWNARADYRDKGSKPENVFGKYNEDTGYFELNTVLDIDYAEAQEIMQVSPPKLIPGDGWKYQAMLAYPYKAEGKTGVRTLMPLCFPQPYSNAIITWCGDGNAPIIRFFDRMYYGTGLRFNGNRFVYVSDVKTLLGTIYLIGTARTVDCFGCNKIEDIHFVSQNTDGMTIKIESPVLKAESINYTIENSTKSLTLILHADAYARVTNEMFEAAAAKNITITSA